MQSIAAWLGRWPVALATCAVLALAVLVPGLGRAGLWEPQERQLADRVAPPGDVVRPPTPEPPARKDGCIHVAPPDAAARSLTARALEAGRDTVGDSDGGRRAPLALLAFLTILASAGIAMRAGGPRAGIITAIVGLAMPLLVLQARMVTSEIGTACGSALILYGLYALARPATDRWLRIADLLLAVAALVAGVQIGFYGGGALLGVLVPVGAFAAAGAFGLAVLRPGARLPHVPALVAGLAALGLVAALAYQLYELKDPFPGIVPPARQMFGRAIVAEGCWSSLLGAIWRPEDDLRFIYDSTFEQIAYGTYPWGILGPIAMGALILGGDARRKSAGALALAWAAAAWIASEAFQRKVGFTIYAGFPAIAIAIGVWIDALLVDKQARLPAAGAMLVGLLFGLAVLDFGKDLQGFAEKLTSLLVGSDTVTYPQQAKVGLLKLKLWVLLLGLVPGVGFALWMILRHRIWLAIAFAGSIAIAAFWAYVWQPRLAVHLSSKTMLERYVALSGGKQPLVLMGDLGHAPKQYAPNVTPELAGARDGIVRALKRKERVFAIAPRTELCPLHREMGESPYYVIEERNLRNLLFSNQLDVGAEDKNPLAKAILHQPPAQIANKPKGRIVWDNRIELLGWDMPARAKRGSKIHVTLYYKVLQQVSGNWKSLMHFDGAARFQGDHEPIDAVCPTSSWSAGDYIVDRVPVVAGGSTFAAGSYELWVGFFTGSAPNFRNMPLSQAPGDLRDTTDRVKIAVLKLD